MKKAFLFSALAAVTVTLAGCGSDEPTVFSLTKEFIVENKTDREIAVSFTPRDFYGPYLSANGAYYGGYGYAYNSEEEDIVTIKIAPGKSELVHLDAWPDAPEHKGNLADLIAPEDSVPYGDDVDVKDYKYPYSMTVGGESIPEVIWLRKQWSYQLNSLETTATYTLTVTDELLSKLKPAETEE
jgi:hypothetical protein